MKIMLQYIIYMSGEYTNTIASIAKPVTGEILVDPHIISRWVGWEEPPFVPNFQDLSPDVFGVAHVGMDEQAGVFKIDGSSDKNSLAATSYLVGCAGAVGLARYTDGSIFTFVSHYSTGSKTPEGDFPTGQDIKAFHESACQKAPSVVGAPGALDGPVLYLYPTQNKTRQTLTPA